MIVLEQEICDCVIHGGEWELLSECGCEEDICPECGYCSGHCECSDGEEWEYAGQGEDD